MLMAETAAVARKRGNGLRVTLPAAFIRKEGLKAGDRAIASVRKCDA